MSVFLQKFSYDANLSYLFTNGAYGAWSHLFALVILIYVTFSPLTVNHKTSGLYIYKLGTSDQQFHVI